METLFILIPIGILVFILMRKNQFNKIHKDPAFLELILEIETFLVEVDNYKNDYFTNCKKKLLQDMYKSTYSKLIHNKAYLKLGNEIILKFNREYPFLDDLVKTWNEEYISRELESNKGYFNNIDGKSLDEQQRRAVVVDEDNNIVVASAGSGKTLTISGKVKYLVEKKYVNPDEILLISFTKKASDEMQERIENRLNISVKAKTFHALGYEILMKAHSFRPDVSNDLDRVVDNYFKMNAINDKDLIQHIITFFGYYFSIPKDLEDFNSLGEVHDQVKDIDFETIKSKIERKKQDLKKEKITMNGEIVKSQEEVIIANFFYLNGIRYEYEKVYPFPSDDPYRKQYRPDFYLSDYDIYLEHFGITRDYKTPWLSNIESKKYVEGLKWKREFHKKNNTTLLETYSYFNREGVLLTKLDKMLRDHNVIFKPANYQSIYTLLFNDGGDRYFKEFKKLVCTFIGLFKSRGFSLSSFDILNKEILIMKNSFLKERARLFISIIRPIYTVYQDKLKKDSKIDFNDMINLATESIKSGVIKLNYKYIIIDEFQDISVSRYNLLKEIKDQTNAKVMAVGDDWQSIYRFTGSDISLFTNFKRYFGYSEILKIERTYRNSQEIIDISGKFIMKNKNQVSKALVSDKRHSNPIRILGYTEFLTAFDMAVKEIVLLYGEKTEIMVIGRNNFDIEKFRIKEEGEAEHTNNGTFKPIENSQIFIAKVDDQVKISHKKYKSLSIFFTTAHKSKGLESENVIIINLANRLLGFPNKISDDPLLSLVLTDSDDFTYAEERRVFYVALTRTKNSCYLLTPDSEKSLFVEELIKEQKVEYGCHDSVKSIYSNPKCPTCQTGTLVIRENGATTSRFLGCTHYPLCDYTLNNIEVLHDQVKCPSCGGYMVRRRGKYGEFYGCTNYPYCSNTIKVEKFSSI